MPIIAKLDNLLNRLNRHGEEYGFPFVLFSWYLVVNYLLDYPFDIYYVGLNHDPHLIAELIAASLSLILALKKFWPEKVKKFYTLCWFSLIIWCLPLREVITFLGDAYPNYMIVVDIMLLIFVLVLIMDWLSFVIVWVTGISLGLLIYYFSNEPIMVHLADYKIPFVTAHPITPKKVKNISKKA